MLKLTLGILWDEQTRKMRGLKRRTGESDDGGDKSSNVLLDTNNGELGKQNDDCVVLLAHEIE
jgi:hypothetical protein